MRHNILSVDELRAIDQEHAGAFVYVPGNKRGQNRRSHWSASCDCGAADPTPHGSYTAAMNSHARHVARVVSATAELREVNS